MQRHQRCQHAHRNREHRDQGESQATQKDQQHDRYEDQTAKTRPHQAVDGATDVGALIEDDIELNVIWQAFLQLRQGRLDCLHRFNGIASRTFENGEIHLVFSINANDVGLDRCGIGCKTDVFDLDGSAVLDRDDDVIEIGHLFDHTLGVDAVIDVANLSYPTGNHGGVSLNGIVDLCLGKPIRLEH